MLGAEGLTNSTKNAILNANYIKERLTGHYTTLYSGLMGRAAHEMILDCREFKSKGIEVSDIAKRLMDYGFHAPTVSFPVGQTQCLQWTPFTHIYVFYQSFWMLIKCSKCPSYNIRYLKLIFASCPF